MRWKSAPILRITQVHIFKLAILALFTIGFLWVLCIHECMAEVYINVLPISRRSEAPKSRPIHILLQIFHKSVSNIRQSVLPNVTKLREPCPFLLFGFPRWQLAFLCTFYISIHVPLATSSARDYNSTKCIVFKSFGVFFFLFLLDYTWISVIFHSK